MKKFLIVIILFISKASFGACGLTISASNVSITWNLNFTYIAVQVTVSKSAAESCSFGIGFTKGNGASYATRRVADGTKTLRYQLYGDNGLSKTLKDYPDISSSDDVITGGFQAGENLQSTINYYLEIPYSLATTPSLVPSGTFTDSYTLNLYEGSDPLSFVTPVDSDTITLTVTVNPMIAISIVNSGDGFQEGQTSRNINFGTLSEGQSQSMDFRLRTNAGFSVTFSSANNGKLKHTNPAKNSLVSYSFYANGALLNMSNSAAVPVVGLTGVGQTSTSGLAYPLKIIIGSVSAAGFVGGAHADEIVITATTTE